MKIDITKEIINYDGKPIFVTDGVKWTLRDFLSQVIVGHKGETNAVKKLLMAQKIYQAEKEVELDKADFMLLKEAVSQSDIFQGRAESLNTVFKGFTEMYFDELKESKKTK